MSLNHALPWLWPLGDLAGVLAHLRHVQIGGEFDGIISLFPYLNDVQTLTFHGVKTPQWGRPEPSPDANLPLLQRLQFNESNPILHHLLANVLFPNLTTLSPDHTSVAQAPSPFPVLPALADLRSLHLVGDFSKMDLPSLSSLPLSHFRLDSWPTPDLFSSLPSTIEFLDFVTWGQEDVVIPRLEDVRRWKVKSFPALRRAPAGSPSRSRVPQGARGEGRGV